MTSEQSCMYCILEECVLGDLSAINRPVIY